MEELIYILSLGGSLSFDTPVRVSEKYDIDSYFAEIVADDDGVHIIWWDFSTDSNDNLNGGEDPSGFDRGNLEDRACAMYMGSDNNGVSFGDRIKVNTSVNAWHSPPTIALGEGGTLAVSWVDLSITQPKRHANVWVSTSTDGTSWQGPYKVTDYEPNIKKWSQEVAVDSGGDVHSAWFYIDPSGTDNDIMHSRSILNQYPEPVEFQGTPAVGDFWARISWAINREPDFQKYKIYISDRNSTFDPSEDDWPIGNLYNTSTYQGMDQELFNRDMMPDTTYWVKVAVMDTGELVSFTEGSKQFHTEPVNLPPRFEVDIDDIHMEEDGTLLGAINLTELTVDGSIWDDIFKGNDDLNFDFEFLGEDPIITARIRKWTAENETYQALDLFSRNDLPNEYGEEQIRLKVIDSGTDGGMGTPDDLFGYSNYFTIFIDAMNDAPYWRSFQDINSGHTQTMTENQEEVIVLSEDSGCVEDMLYQFSFWCEDVDEDDFVTYTCSDPRVIVIKDSVDLQKKSIFKFTPTNDDVPEVNMTITATDKSGGSRNLTLFIAVEGTNDRPVFTSIDGEAIEDDLVEKEFDIMEEDAVTFRVVGEDIDLDDRLSIRTDPQGIATIKKIDFVANTWDITYQSTKEDSGERIQFYLMLEDKVHEYDQIKVIINVENAQDPPIFLNDRKFEWFYDYDETDQNEWGGDGGENIRAEWGEPVRFKPYVADPDGDQLNFTWKFTDVDGMSSRTLYDEEVLFAFYPPDGIFRAQLKFRVNLTVTDGHFEVPLSAQFEIWVWPDDDNDNDGLPDIREIAFFGNLDHGPDEDYDNDTFSNKAEIGFNVDRTTIEMTLNKVDKTQLPDPTDANSYPGHTTSQGNDDEDDGGKDELIEPWKMAVIAIAVSLLIVVIIGIVIVLHLSKKREKEDDEATEKFIKEADRRQKEITGMYGDKMRAGEAIGVDQSTLGDLKIDLGGQVYHTEGSGNIIKKEDEKESGPAWQSSGGSGPLFDKAAPGMEFGESLELEPIPEGDEMDHSGIGEDELNASMDALMESADDYDEEAVKNAGSGKVLIGAVPMEEQIQQMKDGNKVVGPRRPPPGQEDLS